jgi:peptidoglycan LD-endopeptidase CwlK
MSRKIEELHPLVQDLARALQVRCSLANIDIIITQTYRTIEEQDALYAQGRTEPGKTVTNARGGDSFHNYRVAFDIAVMKKGKVDWGDTKTYEKVGKLGEELGLEWGGNFKSIKDLPHFQLTGGLTLQDFKDGQTLDDL